MDHTVSARRRRAFVICTVAFGVVLGFGLFAYPSLVVGWFEGGDRLVHRVHDLGYGAMGGMLLALPLLLQARSPEARPAAMQQFVVAVAAYGVGILLALDFVSIMLGFLAGYAAFAGVLLWLHPSRETVLRPRTRPSPPLAVLVLAGAVPLALYALDMAELQRIGPPTDPHIQEHHWTTMAALAVGIVLVGLLASFRTSGFRIPAWSAGLASVVLGVSSVVFPGYPGALPVPWGIVTASGGVAFIAVAEWEARRTERKPVERFA